VIGAPSVRQKQGPSPEKWRKSVNLRGKRGSRDAVPSSSGAQQLTLLLPALPAGVVITRTGCILPADLTSPFVSCARQPRFAVVELIASIPRSADGPSQIRSGPIGKVRLALQVQCSLCRATQGARLRYAASLIRQSPRHRSRSAVFAGAIVQSGLRLPPAIDRPR